MKREEDEKMTYPRAFSHIGLSVTDLNKAVEFYKEVMGWYVVMAPADVVEENETAIGQMSNVYRCIW